MNTLKLNILLVVICLLLTHNGLGQPTLTEFNRNEENYKVPILNALNDLQKKAYGSSTTAQYQQNINTAKQLMVRSEERIRKCENAIQTIPEKPENKKTTNLDYKHWTESLIGEYKSVITVLNSLISRSQQGISSVSTQEKDKAAEATKALPGKQANKNSTDQGLQDFWNNNSLPASSRNNETASSPEKQYTPPDEVRKIVQANTDNGRLQQQEQVDQLVGKTTGFVQSYYQLQQAGNSYQNMRELSSLNGRYASVDDLERDFRRQSSMIRQEANNFAQAKSAASSSYVDLQTNTAQEKAYGEVLKSFGNIIVQGQANRAEKEAREDLMRQKELIQKQIEAENKRSKALLRNKLSETFIAGGPPLTAHKVQEPVVYMFAYITDKSTFEDEKAQVWLSEVFPVLKFSDQSFPFRNTLINRLKGFGKGEVTLVGFYTEEKAALDMHQSFAKLAPVSEFTVLPFKTGIKKTKGTTNNSTTDFWENKKSASNPKATTVSQSNFWNE